MKKLIIAILVIFAIGLFAPIVEAKAPIISNIRLISPTDRSVTITFQTTPAATSRVIYGTDTAYSGGWVDSSRGLQTDHAITLGSLLPNTTYHYQVQVTSINGETEYSNDQFFTTPKSTDKTPPEISNIIFVFTTGKTTTLSWKTNEITSCSIQYGTDLNFGRSISAGGNAKFFEKTISGLLVNTQYYLRIYAKDVAGNEIYSNTLNVHTGETDAADKANLELTQIRPITNNDEQIGTNQVLITWHTDKAADGTISIGPKAGNYNKTIKEDPPRNIEHKILVTDLTPSTIYHFKITSKDVVGKTATTSDHTFTTNAKPTKASEKPIVNDTKNPKLNVSFYKAKDNPRIYLVSKGFKHYIGSMDILISYGATWADVKIIEQKTLDNLPEARLIKSERTPTVYFLYKNNKKKAIPNATIFESYSGNSWDNIVTLSDLDIDSYSEIRVIKSNDSPIVYLLENNARKSFVNESAFLSRGYKWSDIGIVNNIELQSYQIGESVQ